MELDIDVSIMADGWSDGAQDIVKTAALKAWSIPEGVGQNRMGELSLVLSDDAMVQDLNNQWRGKNSPTNVLSFPADDFDIPDAPRMLGDVVLALQTIQQEAIAQNKDFNHHLTHLVIHGVLHLLGFDHIDEEEANVMEALEIELLANMKIQNPYLAGGIMEEEFITNGR